MPTIRTILHPTDFSADSRPAFEAACSFAGDYGARLILLHVVPPSAAPLLSEPPPNPLEPAESQESLQGKFSWPRPPDPRVTVEHRVAEGDPPDEILRVATRVPCDLLVLGTHGRTGWSRFWLGSVAEEVLRKTRCPVLVVNALPAEAAPASGPAQEAVNPRDAGAYNSYAWLLATCPDDRLRDGKKGVAFARKACELWGWEDPSGLDTLAAAYAEDGQFDEAVKWQKRALEVLGYSGRQGEAARLRLELYQAGRPYRDTRFK
jgi:nucleotide-binding universal stress UspA family protein